MDAKALGAQAAHPHSLEYSTVFLKEGDSPSCGHIQVAGMTKREHIAAMAMQGFITHITGPEKSSGLKAEEVHARAAVIYADALLIELAKDQP